MRVAFQMDHPARLNRASDTTLMLAEEAHARGMACFFFEPGDLAWHDGEVSASLRPMHIGDTVTLGDAVRQPLSTMQVVWMRQDPPFNMRYITATHLLEHANTRVVNDPRGVRNAPEKLSSLALRQHMPPTLISADVAQVHDFARTHGTVVAKPLHGFGGRSVFKFSAGDRNIDTLIEQANESTGEPLMWQAFLPQVASADLRVLLINGEVASVFQREPQNDSIRANMRVGGIAKAATLNARQQAICEALGPWLRAQGLLLVGLDLIGDYLTEINVTSPTGLRAVQALYGTNLAATAWDALA
jgi:glutathione synthase